MELTIPNLKSEIQNQVNGSVSGQLTSKSRSVIMANPTDLSNQNLAVRQLQQEKLELLLIEVDAVEYALRAAQVVRLIPSASLVIQTGAEREFDHPAFIGCMSQLNLPVFDVAVLLGLNETPTWNDSDQIVVMRSLETVDWVVGMRVTSSAEVSAVTLNQLVALPLVVEYNQISLATWALWLRGDDTITALVDPLAALLQV